MSPRSPFTTFPFGGPASNLAFFLEGNLFRGVDCVDPLRAQSCRLVLMVLLPCDGNCCWSWPTEGTGVGNAGHGLPTEIAVISKDELLWEVDGALQSAFLLRALEGLSMKLWILFFASNDLVTGVETLEGEREEALKEETLAREEALTAANLPFFLAERFLLNTLPLPVGVSFCFLKDVASCLFFLLFIFGVFLAMFNNSVHQCKWSGTNFEDVMKASCKIANYWKMWWWNGNIK